MQNNEEHDNIVISGMSGKFPQCDNIDELKEALFDGVDLVTENDTRYPKGIWNIPKRTGVIRGIEKFDSTYFNIHPKQAGVMDARHRLVLESVYECIIDAGFNPKELRGSKIGVYVGISTYTNVHELFAISKDGYSNIGMCLALAANRIAFSFNFNGPSFAMDTACSSSLYAFVNALNDMRLGEADGAFVCATHIIGHPFETLEFNRLHMLSEDGKCKVFSSERNGYVRSETVSCIFLQRESKSRRVYATVLGGKYNTDGYKKEGITYPSSQQQFNLMNELYSDIKIDPRNVDYVETHGTGTVTGDLVELEAITQHFCKNRTEPLLIGGVKSNLGHSEVGAGMASLAKVILAMETGVIPANINCDPIDYTLPGIKDGSLQVVKENTKWDGGIVSINCFGFGGANAHIVLQSYNKEKNDNIYPQQKHRLVQVSGRTEEAVQHFLDEIEKNRHDVEFLALIDEIHKTPDEGHNFRGYTVLGEKNVREIAKCVDKHRPIWFVYTGMGSQWLKMGKDLMNNKIFSDTIEVCAKALAPYGVNLMDIMCSEDPTIFNDITNAFCGIISVEIALTNILKTLEIVPDGICGHSLGEVGCAYADGNMSAEEGVFLAYSRGYSSTHADIIQGQMAAVSLPKEELLKKLPEGVYIACYNAKNSFTISGPKEKTIAFVEQLTAEGIFARLVSTGNVAYHTKYIAEAGKMLLDMCKKFLKSSAPRSSKWFSTSVPPSKQNEPWSKLNCAQYHHNNFCSPVLFDQVYEHIPKNAIVIEIAPHGLLQAILKKELAPETTTISLTNRSSENNESFFLESLGKFYLAGGQLNLRKLYSDVTFPVSRGTKMLSPLVKWDHSNSWFGGLWKHRKEYGNSISIKLSDETYSYLAGHNIDGRVLMPATGYLDLVWETLASLYLSSREEFPVVFENVKFKRATVLNAEESVTFIVNIMFTTGYFEISESSSTVCTGTIRQSNNIAKEFVLEDLSENGKNDTLKMNREDIYKECYLRRYLYKDLFQGVIEADLDGLNGKLEWKGNFCSFLDTMLHVTLIRSTCRDLMLPTSIRQIVIDPVKHLKIVQETPNGLSVFLDTNLNVLKSGGIEITGLECSAAPRRQHLQDPPYLETYDFIPFEITTKNQYDLDTLLNIATQIVIQNTVGQIKQIDVCEIITNEINNQIIDSIQNILDNQAFTKGICSSSMFSSLKNTYDIIVISENTLPSVNLDKIVDYLKSTGFILYKGNHNKIQNNTFQIIFQSIIDDDIIYLLRPTHDLPKNCAVVNVRNSNLDWVEELKTLVNNKEKKTVYLFSHNEDTSGILGLVKCLLCEPIDTVIKSIFVDKSSNQFSIEDTFYQDQLKKNLNYNILKNKKWGTYVHLPLNVTLENKDSENATVSVSTVGDLSTLNWTERPFEGLRIFEEAEQVYVYYSALNFRDIMVATGKLTLGNLGNVPTRLSVNHSLGLEYSGITAQGKRVMGLIGGESLSLQICNDPHFTWEVPKHWSLEDACTVPCVYSTCYYGLILRGQMKRGESILIHSGTGGVGIAAINIALSLDCEIFTTVSTDEKREYLKNMFPTLKDKNIGSSRNKSFEKMIKINTRGRGVDLVLNSLAGDLYQASMRCLAEKGRFIEIGKVDLANSSPIPSTMFLNNISFHGVQLDHFMYPHSDMKKELHKLMGEGMANGVIKPIPTMVFGETEVESAFRCLASGKHKGKVLIQIRKEESPAKLSRTISATQRVRFDPKKSYILVGGLGGFGLELADWLVSRGATKLVLNSRRDINNGYQAYCLRKWSLFRNITVKTNTSDTSNLEGAEELINYANKLGPVGGIFNMALVLKDGIFFNQTVDNFKEVFKTKISSGQNMDVVSRKLCKNLDHFVVMSSVTCGRGNGGQTNYGMANSALEMLCEKRRKDQLPGLAIQWGPIGDVGVLAKTGYADVVMGNTQSQRITSCLDVVEKSILINSTVISSLVLSKNSGKDESVVIKSPVDVVAHILGIKDVDLIDKSVSLSELGLDSLMLTEMKQSLYRNFEIDLDPEEIQNLTINQLLKLGPKGTASIENTDDTSDGSSNIAQSELIKLNSCLLLEEPIVNMNNSTEDKNIFLIHPIEGHVYALKEIAQELKATIYGLQCTSESIFDSITDYGQYYLKKIKEIQPKGPYYLCAYSYGSTIGIELTLLLEKLNEQVKFVCIDGSLVFVKSILENAYNIKVKDGSSEQSKKLILGYFSSTIPEISSVQVAEIIENYTNWDEYVVQVSGTISELSGIDKNRIKLSATSLFSRIKAAFQYEPSAKIESNILLIRREDNPFISEDYCLNEICKHPVEIKKLPGNHKTIVLGENARKVADEINSFFKI